MKQGSHIRIYDVDKGWKVKKDISARNLRWTITDTSLSPDRQYLVSLGCVPYGVAFVDSIRMKNFLLQSILTLACESFTSLSTLYHFSSSSNFSHLANC